MTPGWVAGVTRGRLLLSRRIGPERARAVASCPSLSDGVRALVGSAYGERLPAGADRAGVERGIAATLLWHLRILAGWLPPRGAELVRVLAGWFEIVNVDTRVAVLVAGGREPPPFALGGLATAWPRVSGARSVEAVAGALAGSAWGGLPERSPEELATGLRIAWARRVADAAPEAGEWVAGADALLLARVCLLGPARRTESLRRLPAVADDGPAAVSLDDVRRAVQAPGRWALDGVGAPAELWRAELAWWTRVERDATALLRRGAGAPAVLGIVALLAADAQRTARAIGAAARGGGPDLVELAGAAA